jgi:predicted nucleic acid-binding protein
VSLYFDTTHVAKCYLNEPDAAPVRALAAGRSGLTSSAWCRAEMACVLTRHVREGSLTRRQAAALHGFFLQDVRSGAWSLVPVSEALLSEVESRVRELRGRVFLRAGDAVHLTSAVSAGFREIWTSDRHMVDAAPHFGLLARTL